ncbi:MAG: hypothetical protein M3525_01800 [Acidobacteriota bacterium]|nr:hypothetical protein [Acidobacteriota bacterium]
MCSKGFLKKIVPFFLTFAVGLFIASFFVTVAAPSFQFNNRSRRHHEYHRTMKLENQRLREENARLKAESQINYDNFSATFEMDESGKIKRVKNIEATIDGDSLDNLVPPPPMPPMPPTAPVRSYRR